MLQTCIKNRLIRRGIVALALLAVLLGIPSAAAQTFDEAAAAYERRDYATAIRGFLVHAEQGDASAQFNLGLMYDNGEAFSRTRPKRRAGTGWPPSRVTPSPQSDLGACTPPARVSSRTMPKLCAGTGWVPSRVTPIAQYNLGVMYDKGQGVLKDEAEAARWYRLGCRAG